MDFIADLHIHSHLSRATARNLNLEHVSLWAQLKGLTVVGTGDFTHPQWFSELSAKLEPAEEGLYRLKPDFAGLTAEEVPPSCRGAVRFILGVEISSIYKKNGRTRKVHNVVLVPSLEAAEKINRRLDRIGNIASDGRPILGLDSRALLEIVLEASADAVFIPAHIWTPWFSVLGSKSGFDSLEECFEDLTPQIFAVETGLSSDPAMNWQVSSLDGFTLVSNSDAHSPANLGREANLFRTELSFAAIREALRTGDPDRFLGTIEYFAEEGKYHFDGHRKCEMRLSPEQTAKSAGLCPACGKPVTVGVMNRVAQLADRRPGVKPPRAHPYSSLLTLTGLLAEVLQVGPKTRTVSDAYNRLLAKFGPEFHILRTVPPDAFDQDGPALLAEAIVRMRQARVRIAPGYDGEFGTISLFTPDERRGLLGQQRLFFDSYQESPVAERRSRPRSPKAEPFDQDPEPSDQDAVRFDDEGTMDRKESRSSTEKDARRAGRDQGCSALARLTTNLNEAQRAAVEHGRGALVIVAGPGTGKTRTLTHRIAYLLASGAARPEEILAVTFTNKAAQEMRERLNRLLGETSLSNELTIRTFHALCLDILSQEADGPGESRPIRIISEGDRAELVKEALRKSGIGKGDPGRSAGKLLTSISLAKQHLLGPDEDFSNLPETSLPSRFAEIYGHYEALLACAGCLDFDDLLLRTVRLFDACGPVCAKYRSRFPFLSIDEYQDVNEVQYRLVRLLAPEGHDICVIGDPNQAIYGFRGASSQYFERFCRDYPGAKKFSLTRNYRSTETILRASGHVLRLPGGNRDGETIWSGLDGKKTLTVANLPTEKTEAQYIARIIEDQVGGLSHFSMDSGRVDVDHRRKERGFSDFAVLYRVRRQAESLKDGLRRSGIPFQNVGEERLIDREGIRELISYLRIGLSVGTDFDILRVLKVPRRGIGPEEIGELRAALPALPLDEQIAWIARRFGLGGEQEKNETFKENLDCLLGLAQAHQGGSLEFLARLALQSEQDLYDPRAEAVALMTMHAAKGLEFPVVIIAGCEDGLVPYRREGEVVDLEEERRLFYVALTRAQEELFLTRAKTRVRFGEKRTTRISPFVEAIEESLKERCSPFSARREQRPEEIQLTLFGAEKSH